MLKLTFCLRRTESINLEDVLTYWKNDHEPRVVGHLDAMGCRKYVEVKAL